MAEFTDSNSGAVVPRLNSLTIILSVIIGGIGAFESVEVRRLLVVS